jgi:hypothetical protein
MVATIVDDGVDLEHDLGDGVNVHLRYGRMEFALELYFHDDDRISVEGNMAPLSFEVPTLTAAINTELDALIARVRSAAGRLTERGPTTLDGLATGEQELRVGDRFRPAGVAAFNLRGTETTPTT